MATVKRANVPPTHPTVYAGLALATIGLLLALYAYTGTRVYEVLYAGVALGGALLAVFGILTAAWGRSVAAMRASRARRTIIRDDALALSLKKESSETTPTVAAPASKRRFSFPKPKRAVKPEQNPAAPGAVFAFKRKQPAPEAAPGPAEPAAAPVAVETQNGERVRVTLKCPRCATRFDTEGVRPFDATCTSCGFQSAV